MKKEELVKEKVKELTLLLLHLASWEENEFGMQIQHRLRSGQGSFHYKLPVLPTKRSLQFL